MAMTRLRWLLHCLWCKHTQFRSWQDGSWFHYQCSDCGRRWRRRSHDR